MGPEVLNVVSEVAGVRMLGLLGLLLIVLEGGLHIELATLRKIGMRAFLIAMIGMAAKLMQSLGLLKTHIGKLITCAAMIDDVASLVLLAIISNTVSDCNSIDAVVWAVALPLISSIDLAFYASGGCPAASLRPPQS
jgi:Kef-type K+ transport system membrane component KefB